MAYPSTRRGMARRMAEIVAYARLQADARAAVNRSSVGQREPNTSLSGSRRLPVLGHWTRGAGQTIAPSFAGGSGLVANNTKMAPNMQAPDSPRNAQRYVSWMSNMIPTATGAVIIPIDIGIE